MGTTLLRIFVVLLSAQLWACSLANRTSSHGLLSRRVRALIFPNKASVLITAAMTKIVVGGRPSGFQYSLEFDMYCPLPDTVEGWRPKILIGPTTKKPAALSPKRRWNGHWQAYRRPSLNYQGPYQMGSYAKYTKSKSHKDYFYESPWQLIEQPWQRNGHSQMDEQEEVYDSWQDVPKWKLNRGYRERREVFDRLQEMGKFFQLDFQACIKRAMCEFRSMLNGRGYNRGFLMEDLMRIVLSIPHDITDGKYLHRPTGRSCAHAYAISCPYNVLDFLNRKSRGK